MKQGKRKSSYKSLQSIRKRADTLVKQTGLLYQVWWTNGSNRWKLTVIPGCGIVPGRTHCCVNGR